MKSDQKICKAVLINNKDRSPRRKRKVMARRLERFMNAQLKEENNEKVLLECYNSVRSYGSGFYKAKLNADGAIVLENIQVSDIFKKVDKGEPNIFMKRILNES